jgi:photosystem II stability/assembly factor-like uncharacterized protein/pimeloyl-ACP methyl ester carboxylesterase
MRLPRFHITLIKQLPFAGLVIAISLTVWGVKASSTRTTGKQAAKEGNQSISASNSLVNEGPFGGSVLALAADPTNPLTTYASVGHGFYKTTNGGASWFSISNGLTQSTPAVDVEAVAVATSNPSIVFISNINDGLYKSSDGGSSWTAISFGRQGGALSSVTTLRIDPSNPSTVYVIGSLGFYKTTDGGANWGKLNLSQVGTNSSLLIDPNATSTLYASGFSGQVFKSTDGGSSWTSATAIPNSSSLLANLTFSPSSTATLYGNSFDGRIFRSSDAGATWSNIGTLPNNFFTTSFTVDLSNPNVFYVGAKIDNTRPGSGGEYKSTDGGASWQKINSGLDNLNITTTIISSSGIYLGSEGGVFKSTDGGSTWSDTNNGITSLLVDDIKFSAANPQLLYVATYGRGVFRSSDGGMTWIKVSTGLGDVYVRSLAIDPSNDSIVYAGTKQGLFKSTDGGSTWAALTDKFLSTFFDKSFYSVATDPQHPLTVYAAANYSTVTNTINEFGNLLKSTDGGQSWQQIKSFSNAYIILITIDPTNSSNLFFGTTLGSGNSGPGVFKSTDGGASWAAINTGITPTFFDVGALTLAPSSPSTLFVGVDTGLFKTTSGGASWQATASISPFIDKSGIPGSGVGGLTVDPFDSSTVYVTASVINSDNSQTQGLFKSTDGGATWAKLESVLPSAIVVHKTNPAELYLGTDSGVYLLTQNASATPTPAPSPIKTSCQSQSYVPPNDFSFPSPYYDANGLVIPVKNVSGATQTVWVFDITAYDDSCNSRNTSFATGFFSIENNTSVELYANPAGVYHLRKSDGTEIVSVDRRDFPHTSVGFDLFNGSITIGARSDSWRVGAITSTPTPTPTPTPSPSPTTTPTPSCTPPAISSQPSSQTVMSGRGAVVEVLASGTAPLTYQWYVGLKGDTSHPITDVQGKDAGYATGPLTSTTNYWVRVSNSCGSVDSNTATITVREPLIFIPGIAGSKLNEVGGGNLWPGVDVSLSTLLNYGRLSLAPNQSHNITVTDVIHFTPTSEDIYDSLINNLVSKGGYNLYQGMPGTCPLATDPSLFVFPYDWRQDHAKNAKPGQPSNVDLLGQYIDCIHSFYPGAKVNILAHSTGGLLARRYILAHPTDVDNLITVGSPWLGAPKAINTMETGQFIEIGAATGSFWRKLHNAVGQFALDYQIKSLAKFFPGVHQLLPSRAYFNSLPASPYVVDGKSYSYDQFVSDYDKKFEPAAPGTNNRNFHDTPLQDDWSDPNNPVNSINVKYYHIYGRRPQRDTISQVFIENNVDCSSSIIGGCVPSQNVQLEYTVGDGTVPILSSTRMRANVVNLNSPTAIVFRPPIPLFATDLVSHQGLVRNSKVQSAIICLLDATPQQTQTCLSGFSQTQAAQASAAKDHQARQEAALTSEDDVPADPAYYFTIRGAETVTLADDLGNSITPYPTSQTTGNGLSDVTTNILGAKSAQFILSPTQNYTVTFSAGAAPLFIELTLAGDSATQATRYKDLSLPAGANASLQITPQGPGLLRYDPNGGSNFSETVNPTVSVSGSAAQDTEPPTVSVSGSPQQNNVLVTIAATDSGSGVKSISYSFDGKTYQPYTGPLTVDPAQNPVVYTFADDNVANRSGLVTYYPSPTANPVDNQQFFVRQHYLDFLNRQPDTSGLNFWTGSITQCGSDAACTEVHRINTSAAFFLSIEFQDTGYLVYRTYKAAYGNLPNKPVPITREVMLPDMQEIGNGVIVNQGNWQQQLEMNKQTYFNEFVTRDQFTALYPAAMTPEQYVDALNANIGTVLSQSERDGLVNDLKTSVKSRAQVLRAVAENPNLVKAETNRAFVLMQYFGYLRRNPDDPPDQDFSGWQFWLGKLDQFNGNFVQAEMVKAFLSSIEYRKRFGQ